MGRRHVQAAVTPDGGGHLRGQLPSMSLFAGAATHRRGAWDITWSYPEPLREAAEVTGRVAFFNERVDVVVDGRLLERR